eukprot:Tbor_TRINITY_DN3735_c0_g1::TRINITY_DN3735_c0_g1_i1::g.2456::m.2456
MFGKPLLPSQTYRKLLASPDNGLDLIALSDSTTIDVFRISSTSSTTTDADISANMTMVPLETDGCPVVLPAPPIDACWCPFKSGDINSSFLITSSCSPVQIWDVDGELRASFPTTNHMGESTSAHSVLWRSSNPHRIVAGYGQQGSNILEEYDIHRYSTGSKTGYVDGRTSSVTFGPGTRGGLGSSNSLVAALCEVSPFVICAGMLCGAAELFDFRSRTQIGILGSTNTSEKYLRKGKCHKNGIIQIISLFRDGSTRIENRSGKVGSCDPLVNRGETPLLVTVPRGDENRLLVWDLRNISFPLTSISRGPIPNTNAFGNASVVPNYCGAGATLIFPTVTEETTLSPLGTVPISSLFSEADKHVQDHVVRYCGPTKDDAVDMPHSMSHGPLSEMDVSTMRLRERQDMPNPAFGPISVVGSGSCVVRLCGSRSLKYKYDDATTPSGSIRPLGICQRNNNGNHQFDSDDDIIGNERYRDYLTTPKKENVFHQKKCAVIVEFSDDDDANPTEVSSCTLGLWVNI